MRILGIALLIAALTISASADDRSTNTFVQKTLSELGYDPRPIDGAWGGQTREAMNLFRRENGLTDQKNLSGSSLYLLHRNSESNVTIPSPGELLVGFSRRGEFLDENIDIKNRFCNNNLDYPSIQFDAPPIKSFSEGRGVKGYVEDGDDWFSPLSQGLVVATSACMSGGNYSCKIVWDFVKKNAEANGLQTPVRKRRNSEAFDGTAWIGNTVLSSMIMSAATAASRKQIEFSELAPVLDWLLDRTNHFHFISTSNTKVQGRLNTKARNHSVAATLPSAMMGAWIGDKNLLNRAIQQYKYVLDNMRKDGSFPTETQRGSRALHYTGLQLSYLMTIAEIAWAQNIDLYGYKNNRQQSIHDAVAFSISGWQDWNGVVYKYAKANQGAPGSPKHPSATYFEGYFGWLPAYKTRFPKHPNLKKFSEMTLDKQICSARHVANGYSESWYCSKVKNVPPTFVDMILDNGIKPSLFNNSTGTNLGCMISEIGNLFD